MQAVSLQRREHFSVVLTPWERLWQGSEWRYLSGRRCKRKRGLGIRRITRCRITGGYRRYPILPVIMARISIILLVSFGVTSTQVDCRMFKSETVCDGELAGEIETFPV